MATNRLSQGAAALLQSAAAVDVWKPVCAFLGGGWVALVLTVVVTGRIDIALAASLAGLALVLSLLFIAAWDLAVRWPLLKSRPLDFPPVGPFRPWPTWLRRLVAPVIVLVAGVAFGHWVWH
jgi:hypothetical protein